MVNILVDADACPVKDEILRVAVRHELEVYLVSNQWLRLEVGPNVHKVVVSDGFDAADDRIIEIAETGDIVITGDIPLAARALEKGANVINHSGRLFSEDNIGMSLAMRDLNRDLRDMGEIQGGNKAFEKADRSRFLSALENEIQKLKRGLQ